MLGLGAGLTLVWQYFLVTRLSLLTFKYLLFTRCLLGAVAFGRSRGVVNK